MFYEFHTAGFRDAQARSDLSGLPGRRAYMDLRRMRGIQDETTGRQAREQGIQSADAFVSQERQSDSQTT